MEEEGTDEYTQIRICTEKFDVNGTRDIKLAPRL